MDGIAHELYRLMAIPDGIGIPHPDDMREPGKQDLHWYIIKDGKGYFEKTDLAGDSGVDRKGDPRNG